MAATAHFLLSTGLSLPSSSCLMSTNDSEGSSDAAFQTPSADLPDHEELEANLPKPDIGASPVLDGPVTRSGRKRKNLAPVKSSGKKKNKMIRSPAKDDPKAAPHTSTDHLACQPPPDPRPGPTARPPQDLAELLSSGLSTIKSSMDCMEARLGGKIDSLEASVKKNKETIVILTDTVNKNTVDLARLEAEIRSADSSLDARVAGIVKSHVAGIEAELKSSESSLDTRVAELVRGQASGLEQMQINQSISSSSCSLSPAQVNTYWQCRRSLRLWPLSGSDLERSVHEFLLGFLDFDLEAMGRDAGGIRV